MKEYGKVKLKMTISYHDTANLDADELAENIEVNLDNLGTYEIDEKIIDDDFEVSATLEMDAVRNYSEPTWNENGGDPGYSEIENVVSESDMEKIMEFRGKKAHVYFSSEEWEAA